MINQVTLLGNLGRDPELRHTKGDNAVCTLSVATTRSYKDRDGAWQDETEWHRVTVWGSQGVSCEKYLSKGRQVYVEGRLQTRRWEDDTGTMRYSLDIIANTVKFLGGRDIDAPQRPARAEDDRSPDKSDPEPVPGDDDIPFDRAPTAA